MTKKRKMVMVPLTDDQRTLLQPLMDAVRDAADDLHDTAVIAQVWPDGIVATVCSHTEVYAIQEVLKPSHPWRGYASAAARIDAAKKA